MSEPSERIVVTTTVAIIGAGPAGLMLSHLLARSDIDSVVVDVSTRAQIEGVKRAGILEANAARMLTDTGVSDRILTDGREHTGTQIRFAGRGHRIDFQKLVGESVWLYPQNLVFRDLADARARDGGVVHYGASDVRVSDLDTEAPAVWFTDAGGVPHEVRAELVVGCDGARGICRDLIPEATRRRYQRDYPYAWLGIVTQAEVSSPELIYAHSEHGFALISQRTGEDQRMYLQCDPGTSLDEWSDERIWEQLQARVAGMDGFRLNEGPIVDRMLLNFRSFVQEPMQWGRLVLAGDAAHTVPPTGARGLNLALHDVWCLAQVVIAAKGAGDWAFLAQYQPLALARVWRATNFSYWMTQMLHLPPDATPFDLRRQMGELDNVVSTRAGQTYLAEQYTGWPTEG